MALSSSAKSDLLQVSVLTFFLLAIFFGVTAAWYHLRQVPQERAERDRQEKNLTKLLAQLESKENQRAVREWKRLRKSQKESQDLGSSIDSILVSMRGRVPKVDVMDVLKPRNLRGGKLQENNLKVKFLNAGLRQGLLQFLFEVQERLPSADFKTVKLSNKTKRGAAYEDIWSSEFMIVSYTGDDE